MKTQMSAASDLEQEEGDMTHHMEDAVNQIRQQKQRQREQKAAQEKFEELQRDRFLGEHGIDVEDLTAQEKRDIMCALQNSTKEMAGPSHSFLQSSSPKPSTSGFSSQSFRRNASPVRQDWNDSDEESSLVQTTQSKVGRPIPQRKRPSPEGDEASGAKATRLKGTFYSSQPQTPLLSQRSRRSFQESPAVKPLFQPTHRPRLLDIDRPASKEEMATKSMRDADDIWVLDDDTNENNSALNVNRARNTRKRLISSESPAVKSETVTSEMSSVQPPAKKAPRVFTAEELKLVQQFLDELSWTPVCKSLKRKYRKSGTNTSEDVYQSFLTHSDPDVDCMRLITAYWDCYRQRLHQEQGKVFRKLEWGAPIMPGRHHSRTLDRKLRGEESFLWSDEEGEEENQAPETEVWKPAKCHVTRSGKGGRGGKGRPLMEAEESADAVAEPKNRKGDPIPLPGPSGVPFSSIKGLRQNGKTREVPSMDYNDFVSECDAAPKSSQKMSSGSSGGVGSGDAIAASQGSASDSILNSQGDIYSTQFPRRKNRGGHVSDESNDSVDILPRISKRNRLEALQKDSAAATTHEESVLPTRKRSRTQESALVRGRRVPTPPVELEMDCITVESDSRGDTDVYTLDDNEDAEREEFRDYLAKKNQIRTYSRRRPLQTVPFAQQVERDEEEKKNVFNTSANSAGSQPGSQDQGEDSGDEVQLLSSSLSGNDRGKGQNEETTFVRRPRGLLPKRRLLKPVVEEDGSVAEDIEDQNDGGEKLEEERNDNCTMISCPMCQREFPDLEIEVHAAYCNGPEPEPERIVTRSARESKATSSVLQDAETEQGPAISGKNWEEKGVGTVCLFCDKQFPDSGLTFKKHLNLCRTRATARAREMEELEAMGVEEGANSSSSSNPTNTRSRAGAACQ